MAAVDSKVINRPGEVVHLLFSVSIIAVPMSVPMIVIVPTFISRISGLKSNPFFFALDKNKFLNKCDKVLTIETNAPKYSPNGTDRPDRNQTSYPLLRSKQMNGLVTASSRVVKISATVKKIGALKIIKF